MAAAKETIYFPFYDTVAFVVHCAIKGSQGDS